MANTNAPMGFSLHKTGGKKFPRYVERLAAVPAAAGDELAVGDGYTVANNEASRATAAAPNGICVGIVLQAKDGQGPESLTYIPAGQTGAKIIGIEDETTEFEVECNDALTAADFDAGAKVDIVDTAPNTTLGQSRQAVTGPGGASQLALVRLIDRPGNVYGANQKVVVRLLAANVIN